MYVCILIYSLSIYSICIYISEYIYIYIIHMVFKVQNKKQTSFNVFDYSLLQEVTTSHLKFKFNTELFTISWCIILEKYYTKDLTYILIYYIHNLI